MSIRTQLIVFLLCAAPVFFLACATPVRETGFLEHGYQEFNVTNTDEMKVRIIDPENWEEPVVFAAYERELAIQRHGEQFVVRPAMLAGSFEELVTAHPVVFVIPEPIWNVDLPYPNKPDKNDEITFTVRERLYRYLLRKYPHPTRVRYACTSDDPMFENHRFITIQTHLTWYDKGFAPTRYVLGWGIGQASIQIEGDIFDGFPHDGKKIAEFAIRADHAGFAQNGLNVNVLDSAYCLKYAAEEAIRLFTEDLPRFVPGINYRLHGELPNVVRESTDRRPLNLASN